MLLTIANTVYEYVDMFNIIENTNPFNDGKCYKIEFIWIVNFKLSAQPLLYLIWQYKYNDRYKYGRSFEATTMYYHVFFEATTM